MKIFLTEIAGFMRRNFLYNNKLKDRARGLRNGQTSAEKKLWYQYLKNSPHRYLRQRPIGNYIVDFYCPALKLVIEVDGDDHYTEQGLGYDEERTAYLLGLGIEVIRIRNDEVLNHFDKVCQMLNSKTPFSKGGAER